ncbi:uncharacterized protein ATC70_003536 [Mucor velutinosus]|uniref:Uncharacterized protein n=1 Tax=Mucor velutinosus TaxID=708070 RepID=A0AAN7HY30_9FUNG|nr:hypothetical protein ATC70_003536 [Mucor velutinosus]
MSSFGRWFNLPKKRSNSTPTRQVLSEFLNRSATESFLPPQHQQYSYHYVSSASAAATGYSSLPATSSTAKPLSAVSAAQSAPLLITSSFYDLAYPFEPCDSPEDETSPEVVMGGTEDRFSNSRPATPPSTTTDVKPQQTQELNSNHKNKQQQMIYNIQVPPSPQPLPNTAHYYMPIQRDYKQDDTLNYYPRETTQPLTWHSKSSPKKIPLNKGGHPSIKRRPTPFADQKSGFHSYDDGDEDKDEPVFEKTQYEGIKGSLTSAMDDHQINYTAPGKTFNSDAYDAEVRKLRSEIKRMEKKHKKHERHILDAQQQLEYLMISRSYDSSFLSRSSAPQYTHNEQWEPPPSSKADTHHYYSQSFNEQQYRPSYWYPAYDTDYYYNVYTPNNSYPTNTASFRHVSSLNESNEPYDYAHVPQKSNEAILSASHCFDMNDSNNHYFYGYQTPSYASSNATDDKSYYYQLQQRQQQLPSYGRYRGYTPPGSRESKKRWTQ